MNESHTPNKIEVDEKWLERVMDKMLRPEQLGCPFCGHPRPRIIATEECKTFYSRKGCLECNEWFEPVQLKT